MCTGLVNLCSIVLRDWLKFPFLLAGGHSFSSSSSAPRLALNSSSAGGGQPAFPSIQLLGLEMLLHYFLGSEVTAAAAKSKLQLSLGECAAPSVSDVA